MIVHDKIKFRSAPRIWLKDKFQTILKQKQIYIISLFPGIFIIIGLVADLKAIFTYSNNDVIILLLCFLFFYGLLNFWLISVIERTAVRLQRQKSTAKILHKVLIEGIREYLTYKRTQAEKSLELGMPEIKKYLSDILNALNDQYISVYYRPNTIITIKYLFNNQLYPFRVGENVIDRSQEPEHYDKSFVYQAITRSGNKLTYIYVKNLDNVDQKETKMMMGFEDEIKSRAANKYKTFIAVPIRLGNLITHSTDFTTRPDLGILGFDSKQPYSFGNLEESEIHVFACIADMLSEPVKDLIEITKRIENGSNKEPEKTGGFAQRG